MLSDEAGFIAMAHGICGKKSLLMILKLTGKEQCDNNLGNEDLWDLELMNLQASCCRPLPLFR